MKKHNLKILFSFAILAFLLIFAISFGTKSFKKSNGFSVHNNNYSYIVDDGFWIDSTSETSVQFSIEVNNINNNYDYENEINVTLDNENGDSVNAEYVETTNLNGYDVYTYQIDNLSANEEHSIYSLNNTNFKTENSKNDDNEILVCDELNANNNDFFTIDSEENPYIVDDSFEIISSTNSEIYYSLDIIGDYAQKDTMQVNLTGEDPVDTVATLDEQNGNEYIYKISDLNANTLYTIFSLYDTNLAVGSATNPVDNLIVISSDLHVTDDNVKTEFNPYIVSSGFKITDVQSTSIQFYIQVNDYGDNFNYENSLNVKLNNQNGEIVKANFVKVENNKYYYQIDNLIPETSYSIYAFLNSDLAVGSPSAAIDSEILVQDDLGITNSTFTTISLENSEAYSEMNLYYFPIFMSVLILAFAFTLKYKTAKNSF